MPPALDAPIFVIGAPHTGDVMLLAALRRASGVWHPRVGAATFLDELPAADPAARGFDSHRLTAGDAPAFDGAAQEALAGSLVDREGRTADGSQHAVRAVAAGSRLALRVPLLAALFPDARFVLLTRDPDAAVQEAIATWREGSAVSVPELPGWDGPWSLPLVPGWRDLAGRPLEEVVREQWRIVDATARADVEALPGDRWRAAEYERLLEDPRDELRRLCAFLHVPYDQALLTPFERARRSRPAARTPEASHSAFASEHTASVPERLRALSSSLLVSTYQTGKLVAARERDGLLNTHFRDFDKPMGMAVAPGRLCLGTRTEVWDMRDLPDAAAKLDPPGSHDACYLPRNRHVTGDVAIHEMGFAQGELWIVATAFSCLATLDATHSFVPRWKPPFVSEVAPGDRCHLNGMAVVDDRVRYVTALGRTDEPGGWRAGKATGGVLLDVPSGETVVDGLSMPHSPRWHGGHLWVLESGKGELCVVDRERGRTETVVELPGFTRGLAFAGTTAFVGLSQIRESSTFGDLPLTHRLSERLCGVWMVDVQRGTIDGFLRFEDLVQEVFDVALLPGTRYPEIAPAAGRVVEKSYVLP